MWTKHLLEIGNWKVHAVDLFQPSLDDLAQSVPLEEKERLVLDNSDFRAMTFPQQVDLILANNSLSFVPREDLKPVLDNIYENLRPGGILAATFWGQSDVRGEDPQLSTFSQEEVKALFTDKYSILSCCKVDKGKDPNLDGDIVTWSVIYAIVQKPYAIS